MANVDEGLGQDIGKDIDAEEDQISKQGGVGVNLEDFTSSSVEKSGVSAEDDTSSIEKIADADEDIVEEVNNSDETVMATETTDLIDNIINDVELLSSVDTEVDINLNIDLDTNTNTNDIQDTNEEDINYAKQEFLDLSFEVVFPASF